MPPVAATAETDTVAAAATGVPSAGPVPGTGPQVFDMATDDSEDEGAGEDSDGDFSPDFPAGPQVFDMASKDESEDEGEDSDGDFFPDWPVAKPEPSTPVSDLVHTPSLTHQLLHTVFHTPSSTTPSLSHTIFHTHTHRQLRHPPSLTHHL